jgi:hypothetical protein
MKFAFSEWIARVYFFEPIGGGPVGWGDRFFAGAGALENGDRFAAWSYSFSAFFSDSAAVG